MNSPAVNITGAPKPAEGQPQAHRRLWMPRILTTFAKFALDSAANTSLKGIMDGKKVHKIVEEELKGKPSGHDVNDKKLADFRCAREEMRAKMEKMHEDMNNVLQQNMTSKEHTLRSETLKKTPNENTEGSEIQKTEKERVFIRSRL